MAVLYITENPQASTEIYDKVRDRLKDEPIPSGALFHVAAKREGGGLLVVELWESEAARNQWSPKVEKAIADVGGPKRPEPRKLEVHNIIIQEAMSRA